MNAAFNKLEMMGQETYIISTFKWDQEAPEPHSMNICYLLLKLEEWLSALEKIFNSLMSWSWEHQVSIGGVRQLLLLLINYQGFVGPKINNNKGLHLSKFAHWLNKGDFISAKPLRILKSKHQRNLNNISSKAVSCIPSHRFKIRHHMFAYLYK